ncbi:hypothetical protein B0H11DRAFT_2269858 [Mycena galericulata]|nr:hypothetical protein B0H11DRAFT_2269858 [Mycena galericulata]
MAPIVSVFQSRFSAMPPPSRLAYHIPPAHLFSTTLILQVMDSFTTTTSKVEDIVLPPVNDDNGTGSSGSCVVCKEDTELPPVNDDNGTGSSGSCVIA